MVEDGEPVESQVGQNESLTELQRRVLDFERDWHGGSEQKEDAMRERLGMSPVRYAQVLLGLLGSPAALAAEPVLIHRLQRLRDARRAGAGRII
ncbi:MAG: DUF3263 domain-containing protein [Microbacteriaceae bacterium]|jgi:hypothetical protein|nr:DUF3263 domain-containing protein [Microbacteriaceae bacterium]MCI1206698.1 DUF3263 domain-containing protein [Microbacteriaceae bacterium]